MAISERKNKDGSWSFRARVRDSAGKFYRSEWKRHKDQALAQEAELLAQRRSGAVAQATCRRDGETTTTDEFWAVYRVENRTEVSDGWKLSQEQMWRDYVRPVIGKKPIGKVDGPDVSRVLARMKELGRGEQMRSHVYRLMLQVFNAAQRLYRMIAENPVMAEYHSVKVPKTQRRFLRPEQSWSLLEAALAHPAIWIELLAGLRTEAAVALTWGASVQWDVGQFLICQAWKAKVRRIEPLPKGKQAEYVPMAPVLREYLWDRFQQIQPAPSDFVCPGPRGGMLKPETFGPQLKRLCRIAGVPEVSPHELRHSCTELFVRQGATQEDLRRLLNHKSGATTLRYIHRTEERLQSIAARIERPPLHVVSGGNGGNVPIGSTQVGTDQRTPVQEAIGR